MARTKGILSVVTQAANGFATLQEWELDETPNDIDGTVIGGPVGAVDPGPVTYTLTATGFYDANDPGMSAITAGAEGVSITVQPVGAGSGNPQAVGVYNILQFTTRTTATEKVMFSIRAVSDGSAALDKTPQT